MSNRSAVRIAERMTKEGLLWLALYRDIKNADQAAHETLDWASESALIAATNYAVGYVDE